MEAENTIQEGIDVIVRKDSSINLFTVKEKKQFWLDKTKFSFQGVIGQPFGTRYNLVDHNLVKAVVDDKTEEEPDCGSGDNRNLQDVGLANQKLSSEDIEAMRKEGVSGQDIVDRLVVNSETFDSKTEFSKEKYLRKKKKKHLPVFTILKPNYRLMFEYYQRRGKNKLGWIREDGIAQLLCQGNVRSGGRYLVVDGIEALLTGAVLHRLGTDNGEKNGHIIEFFSSTWPAKIQGVWSRAHFMDHVYSVPTSKVEALRYAVLGAQAQPSTTLRRDPPRLPVEDGQNTESSDQTVTEAVLAQPAVRYTDFSHLGESDTIAKYRCTPCDPGCYNKKHKTDHGENGAQHGTTEAQTHGAPEAKAHEASPSVEEGDGAKRKETSSEGGNEASWKQKRFEQAVKMLTTHKMDGLFIAFKSYPLPIMMDLVEFLAPSRQVVVYCPYQEAVMMCYKAMKESGRFVNVNLSETWLRDYQVLPNRTHPTINMSGGGGYLLTATTIHKD